MESSPAMRQIRRYVRRQNAERLADLVATSRNPALRNYADAELWMRCLTDRRQAGTVAVND